VFFISFSHQKSQVTSLSSHNCYQCLTNSSRFCELGGVGKCCSSNDSTIIC